MSIPTRPLGATGARVTVLGLGGEGVLRSHGRDHDAQRLVRRALDLGVTYFESARAYAGSEGYLGRALGADRQRVFLASKSHYRHARGAQAHLEESLDLLRTDWLDLWLVHDVRSAQDLNELAGPGGALDVFRKAKKNGTARFLGVSGHQSPEVLLEALELFPFDCVLLPVNPAETLADGFAQQVLPVARERKLGVIAMKTLCHGLVTQLSGYAGTTPFLRYALSEPGVALASVGCDDVTQLEENVAATAALAPLSGAEREALEQFVYPAAPQLRYYRP